MPRTEHSVAICCYTYRVVASERCQHCKSDYGCLTFKTTAELLQFNALIPPSMRGSPLPLNLWPERWLAIVSDAYPESAACAADADSPLRALALALGLKPESDSSSPAPTVSDPQEP
ncbi:MAG: hypothetical protein QOF32_2065 [Gammaproteobacteria bacterium]|jgi:hypothetical protein|nr:hypothetical protein [Gammaproteobacteria bacterium]